MPEPENTHPVGFSPEGPQETVLDPPDPEARAALDEALGAAPGEHKTAVAGIAARWPQWSEAWALLGQASEGVEGVEGVEAYAYFRVGYHRGLDQLRGSGWRGTGYVRGRHDGNRGFLLCLEGLARTAAAIGEDEEAERCATFLRQLDPDWNAHE